MADFKVAAAKHVEPYQGSNTTQHAAMIVTDDVSFFAGLLGGRSQVGGVALAETKTTTVVAAETANVARGTAATKAVPKQGIYEFPDAATGGGRI